MSYQFSCLHSSVSCYECKDKNKCNIYWYVMDLTAERWTCRNCKQRITAEHAKYCPYCGVNLYES